MCTFMTSDHQHMDTKRCKIHSLVIVGGDICSGTSKKRSGTSMNYCPLFRSEGLG